MNTILVHLFAHNVWANLRVIDACAALADEQLDATATGTYGSVRDTLVHMVAAESRYLSAFSGEPPQASPWEGTPFPGFGLLRERAAANGNAFVRLVSELDDDRVLQGTRGGQPYSVPARVFIVQAINHATEHRAQVAVILTQRGVEPPVLDGWTFGTADDVA